MTGKKSMQWKKRVNGGERRSGGKVNVAVMLQ
jgi:hypothetical protein